ncbi:MAG: cobalt ECF transporter T component CbiQ [Oscillospiraceae bacterium]|nr:cobalt ECF transporter T component CbiQ [Oscillospiraceae bacterium]
MFNVITALLIVMFTGLSLYGRVSILLLACVSVGMAVFLTYFNSHSHNEELSIDIMAQTSRLRDFHPVLKFWTLIALLFICVASKSVYTGIFLSIMMMTLSKFAGGLKLHNYIGVLIVPIRFLLIGGLALLLETSPEPMGIVNCNIFGIWLCVTPISQIKTALVISRAFGAVSCLCLLSTSTPMPDIIAVLRKAHCPEFIIDLMYLIYRYIFILTSLHHEMHNAAKSRLGFKDYRTSLRSTAMIYASLLGRSFQFAGKNFDAMESRCYDTGISFLQRDHQISPIQVFVCAVIMIVSAGLHFLPL